LAYETSFSRHTRHWELTCTRYFFGPATLGPVPFAEAEARGLVDPTHKDQYESLATVPWCDVVNLLLDPEKKRFRLALRYDIEPKPGVIEGRYGEELTAVIRTNGAHALIEFTGALPRAKLYTHWQVSTNDTATLQRLADPAFDPVQTVLVADPIPGPQSPASSTNQPSGTVQFASYAPKRIELRAQAVAPSVLLLNDRFDPNWKVTVDGKPATLLRCNYVVRGVQVPQGNHLVLFRYEPSTTYLYVSVAALIVGLALIGFLVATRTKENGGEARVASGEARVASGK
jgi:hypothetical protein